MSQVSTGRYGDKVIVGGLGGAAVSLSDLSDEQLAALESLASLRLPAEDPEDALEPEPGETSKG
jgi:hypothetical protein